MFLLCVYFGLNLISRSRQNVSSCMFSNAIFKILVVLELT